MIERLVPQFEANGDALLGAVLRMRSLPAEMKGKLLDEFKSE